MTADRKDVKTRFMNVGILRSAPYDRWHMLSGAEENWLRALIQDSSGEHVCFMEGPLSQMAIDDG